MNYKDARKLEEYKHECILTQMEFDRQTRLMVLEKEWELSFRKPIPVQPQYSYEVPQYEPQLQEPEVEEEQKTPEEKSKEKYGGKKK